MHKSLAVVALVMGLVLSGAPAAQTEDISSPKLRIAWDEFKKLYDDKAVVLIDVRGADAFETGHIPGSRSIPLDHVPHHIDELKKIDKPIVFYCA